jgi:hypothetical protein
MQDMPYKVVWGWCESQSERFRTFAEAQVLWAKTPGARILRPESVDLGNEVGLSRDEREAIELAGGQ